MLASNIRKEFGVIIVAIKKTTNRMIFTPQPTELLNAGDEIVFLGKTEDLEKKKYVLS